MSSGAVRRSRAARGPAARTRNPQTVLKFWIQVRAEEAPSVDGSGRPNRGCGRALRPGQSLTWALRAGIPFYRVRQTKTSGPDPRDCLIELYCADVRIAIIFCIALDEPLDDCIGR